MKINPTTETRRHEGSTKTLLRVFFVSWCLCGSLLSAAEPIRVGPPEKRSLVRTVEQPGHIEPFAQTPLLVRISGYVKAVHADIGDHVKAGQVLAELDVPELVEELNQKTALVAQAKSEITQAEKLLAVVEKNVQSAAAAVTEAMAARKRASANYDRWKSETARVEALVARKIIDEQTRDETLNQFRSAEAMRDEVEAKVHLTEAARAESEAKRDKSHADVAVAKSKASVAAAEEGRVRAMVGYAKIVAPFDGVVTFRNVDVGHFLQPGKDSPIFVVTMSSKVRVFVDVPEADAAAIADNAKAMVRVQVLRGREFPGAVTRTAWSLDSKSHTLRTEIDLLNGDGTLRPGMYAYATITITPPATWTLPAAAIVKTADGAAAYLVKDGKATRVAVQTGTANATYVEILKWRPPQGWSEPTGSERFVLLAAGVIDGQVIEGR